MSEDENRQILEDFGGDGLNRRVAYAIPEGTPLPNLQFWQTIESQLKQCGDILEECGFARDDFNTDGHKEPYQDAWYAAQVGWRCRMVLDAHAAGEALHEVVLLRILQIGTYATEWQWRLTYRPSILTGAPVRKGGKLGGEMRAEKYAPHTLAVLEEMTRLRHMGHSIKRSAEISATNGIGTSADANRKLWNNHIGPKTKR